MESVTTKKCACGADAESSTRCRSCAAAYCRGYRKRKRGGARPCAECQASFLPTDRRQKYCSAKCRIVVQSRNFRAKPKPGPREPVRHGLWVTGACMVCGDPTPRDEAPTCGTECGAVWRGWVATRESIYKRTKRCLCCGSLFTAKTSDRLKYCSRECAFEDKAAAPYSTLHHVTCSCGTQFISRTHRAVHCSEGCKAKKRPCVHCGEVFVVTRRWQRACSDLCEVEGRQQNRRRHARKFRHLRKHRKRAAHYGAEYEPISRVRVLNRDGWRCGICGGKIDRARSVPHPKSGTLDHIIPLSRGGGHLYTNVQAAHFICNSMKGARSAGEQLLLVG